MISLERMPANVAIQFLDRVAAGGTREAFRYPYGDAWKSVSWQTVGDRVRELAAGLLTLGLLPEQRVGIISSTRYEWIVADLAVMCAAGATTKAETLDQVRVQMEKLAKQTNAAIDSLAKGMATRAPVQTTFSDNYAKEGISYTVQKGDTLSSIAQKTGAKTADIINANKIADPSRITVGQTFFIPGGK